MDRNQDQQRKPQQQDVRPGQGSARRDDTGRFGRQQGDAPEQGDQGLPGGLSPSTGPTPQGQPEFAGIDNAGIDIPGPHGREGRLIDTEEPKTQSAGKRAQQGLDREQGSEGGGERGGAGGGRQQDDRGGQDRVRERAERNREELGRERERGELTRDQQGERDTEIRRETEFRNATATPLDEEAGGRKVTKEDDLFGREGEA